MSEGLFRVEAPDSEAAERRSEIRDLIGRKGVDVVALVNEKPRAFPTDDLVKMDRGDIPTIAGDQDAT